jgi:hypothetical protein
VSAAPLSHLFNEDVYSIPPIVTIVINKPWESISEDHKVLLGKILGAVKVSLSSARIIKRDSVTLEDLKALGNQKILIFGTPAPVNQYETVQAQGFSVIRADELSALDDVKKKNLWLALKTMFGA